MIFGDKKKAIGVIMSRINEDGRETGSATLKNEASLDEKGEAMQAIGSEILSAIQGGSAIDLAQALQAFHAQMSISDD